MSHDPLYVEGYEDGQSRGREIGVEEGIQRGFQALVGCLADYIAANPWLWSQGDGYGGYVRYELEQAFAFWDFPKPPKVNSHKVKRTPLKTSQVIAAMLASAGKCVACGTDDDLQVDHILPVSRGGTNDPDNLQMLCQPCNASKRDKTMDEWQGGAR